MAGRDQEDSDSSPVVIIGGGIIGLSTAYYHSLHGGSRSSITIVESADTLFAGASGQANGILGNYDFPPGAESLGELSWKLHQKLANKHGGRARWGYRDVVVYKTDKRVSLDASKLASGSEEPPAPLPAWCKNIERHARTSLSRKEHAARINPADFCRFLQENCEAMGVRIVLNATVTDIRVSHGSLESVVITQPGGEERLKCYNLVIAAGPYSERLLSGLFPNSRVRIPSSKQPSSGNYMVVKTPKWNGSLDTEVCHQIYLQGLFGHQVDVSSRPDGTLYIGGSLAAQESTPETIIDVQTRWKDMRKLVAKMVGCPLHEVEILKTGTAYRPCLESGRPIICHVSLEQLLGVTHQGPNEKRKVERGGVYLNVGHGRDGITLGPGSGKVMSELIRRGESLAHISCLGIF